MQENRSGCFSEHIMFVNKLLGALGAHAPLDLPLV